MAIRYEISSATRKNQQRNIISIENLAQRYIHATFGIIFSHAHRQRKHYLPKYFQFWFEFLLLLSLLLLLLLVNTCSILCSPLYDSIQHFSIRMFFPSSTSSSSSCSFSFSNQHVMEMKLTYIIYANNNACT